MKTRYSQISLEERLKIERWRHVKVSIDEIAAKLGRHRSTIFRELKRNHFQDISMPKVVGYFAMAANLATQSRRSKKRKLIKHPALQQDVVNWIKNDGWTPEQIAGHLKLIQASVRVCQETIYRFVYSKEGMKDDLWWYLPEHRKKRQPRRARKRMPPKIRPENNILFRPDIITNRKQFGHWEGDLMLFQQKFGQGNVTSLVERFSRFTVLLKNSNKKTKNVMDCLIDVMSTLPFMARRSVTFDRGSEFMGWPHLEAEVGAQVWFCDPSAPWQKGTVENTNRRARRWLPRELNPKTLTDHELQIIFDRLNATPRKCLGWKTPAQVFRENILEEAA